MYYYFLYTLGVNIFVGGQIGAEAHLAETPVMKGIPFTEEDLLPVLTDILVNKFNGKLRK